MVLTKEVSRFARNTIDSLTYTRELLRAGVGVYFQNDGICTIDTDSELRLSIMSSIAADEVRKLSERVRWGHKRSIENGVGMVLAAILFMKRMADVTEAHAWVDVDDEETDVDNILRKKIPARTRFYEINGPMFFAASERYKYMLDDTDISVLIIRMRNVPAIDSAGVEALSRIVKRCEREGVKVVFSHVNEQPMHAMQKAGLAAEVGEENFCPHIDTALERAGELVKA